MDRVSSFRVLALIVAGTSLLAPRGAGAAELEGIDVSPKTVRGGDEVVVTIVLDQPGAQPVLRVLGDTEALDIPTQAVPIFNAPSWSRSFTTSPVQDRTHMVQIRAEWQGRSRATTLRVLPEAEEPPPAPAPPDPPPATVVSHVFDTPSEVSALARLASQRGFRFRAKVRPGDSGDCRLTLSGRVRLTPLPPIGPVQAPPPRCNAVYFEGRLAPGWRVDRVDLQGGPGEPGTGHAIEFDWVKRPGGRHGDATLAILTKDALPNEYIDLVEVVLEGPPGDWRDAFDR